MLSTHARYAAHTAAACGYGFRSLDGADGYLFEVSDGARRALFCCGAGTPYAFNNAAAAALARDKAFCAEALRLAGVSVLPGRMFFVTERWAELRSPGREPADARAFAAAADYPLFCKPNSGSSGAFAELIESAEAFGDYMHRVSQDHYAILAQPYVAAPEYRAIVLDGRVLCSYRKHPAKAGAPANRSAGGHAGDLRDGAPAALEQIALKAAEVIRLGLAAIDVFDRDGALVVIEVNSNPMLRTLEDHGRWDLIETIWRANFAAALR